MELRVRQLQIRNYCGLERNRQTKIKEVMNLRAYLAVLLKQIRPPLAASVAKSLPIFSSFRKEVYQLLAQFADTSSSLTIA
jgi:hypothetical protein